MNTVKAFLKKYWITCCIFIGLVALYIFLTSNGLVNPYLFPSTDKIKAAFIDSKDMMFGNAVAFIKFADFHSYFAFFCLFAIFFLGERIYGG